MSNNENTSGKNTVENKILGEENARALKSMSSIEILIHGRNNPNNADLFCDNSMFEKKFDYRPLGKWVCDLQTHYYANDRYGIDSMDYLPCMHSDHNECPIYMKHMDAKSGNSINS